MSAEPLRILLAGLPRSGTTWVANVLAAAPAVRAAIEPDNEKTSLLARRWKRHQPRFPVLVPGDQDPGLERLWRCAFEGRLGPVLSRSWLTQALMRRGRRAEARVAVKPAPGPRRADPHAANCPTRGPGEPAAVRLVKTVHAILCLDWVCEVGRPQQVVIVDRHPLAVIDSWRRLSMPDGARLWRAGYEWLEALGTAPHGLLLDDALVRMALQAGLMYRCLEDFCGRRPDVIRVGHEQLCRDPAAEFAGLHERLGLPWTGAGQRALAASNREGRGFRPVRVTQDEIGKWQGRYGASELERVRDVLGAFGLDIAMPS